MSHTGRAAFLCPEVTMALAKRAAAVAALVLAAFAFLGAVVSGFAAPSWVLPLAVLLAAAVLAV